MATPGDTIKHIILTFISPRASSWQPFGRTKVFSRELLARVLWLMSASATWFTLILVTHAASERAFVSSSLESATPFDFPLSSVLFQRDNSRYLLAAAEDGSAGATDSWIDKCLFMLNIAQVLGKVLAGYLLFRSSRGGHLTRVECIRLRGIEMYWFMAATERAESQPTTWPRWRHRWLRLPAQSLSCECYCGSMELCSWLWPSKSSIKWTGWLGG